MKQGDKGTVLTFTIIDQDGVAVDLSSAASVTLVGQVKGTTIGGACTITDASNGVVQYTIDSDDLTLHGRYKLEVRVEMSDGDVFTSSRIIENVERKLS